MTAEYALISQESSKFRKKTAKKSVLPPKFQKVRFEMHNKVINFENIYGKYSRVSNMCINIRVQRIYYTPIRAHVNIVEAIENNC